MPTTSDFLHRALDPLTAQQDYAWFLAWLAWAATAAWLVALGPKRHAQPSWLLWTAVAQVMVALVAMLQHATPPANEMQPHLGWDFAVLAAHVLQAGALARDLRQRHRASWPFAAIALLAIGAVWQATRPVLPGKPEDLSGGLLIAILTAVCIGAVARTASSRERQLLLLLLAGCLLEPHGPLATFANEARHWVALSLFSTPAALVATCAGLLALRLVHRGAADRTDASANLRRPAGLIVGVLGVAFLVAFWMAGRARRDFENSLMVRAHAFAAVLDTGTLAHWLEHRFTLGAKRVNAQFYGGTIELYHAPAINDPSVAPLRAFLGRMESLDTNLANVHLATILDGQLVCALAGVQPHGPQDTVARHRAATPADLAAWGARAAYFSPPFMSSWGPLVRAWAPVADHERMLGWVAVDATVPAWDSVQAQARLQTFALAGLGVGLILMAELQRRRAAERAAAQAEARAARAADEAKGSFLLQVSHELRTPLQSILGFADLLKSTRLEPQQQRWLDRLAAHGGLLVRLVDDLLDLSAQQAGTFRFKPAPGDLAAVLAEAVEALRPRARDKQLHLTLVLPEPPLPRLSFDATRVRQIVQNLVGNAVKFTQRGGIDVTLRCPAVGPDAVSCELIVRDTGPGIPPDEQGHLFRPFARLERTAASEGVGMGLTLSRAICRELGGDITIDSALGQGATFTARWTLRVTLESVQPVGKCAPGVRLDGRRVLVADDNAFVRELFVEFIRSRGALVATAEDGIDALDQCRRQLPDVLVVDLSMPRLDGYGVAEQLRSAGAQLRIVGVSAHAGAAERTRARACGMDAFLTKPVPLTDLLGAIAPYAEPPAESEGAVLQDLRRRLRRQFDAEMSQQLSRLEATCSTGDWPEAARLAHYLKNGADVVQLADLSEACAAFERAALVDSGTARAAFQQLRQTAARYAAPLSTPSGADSPATTEIQT